MMDPRSGRMLESFLMGHEMYWDLLDTVDADLVIWHHPMVAKDEMPPTTADTMEVNVETVR